MPLSSAQRFTGLEQIVARVREEILANDSLLSALSANQSSYTSLTRIVAVAIPTPSATNTSTVVPTTATPVVVVATETPTATNTPVSPTAAPTSMETLIPPPSPTPTPTPPQTPISRPLVSLNVWDVVINPKDSKEIYVVVGGEGRGIYKTADGGNSWALIEGRYGTIECLAIDPKDPRILYAGLWEGILKSTDGGANWKAITAPKESGLPLNEMVHTLAVVPDNPRAVYAGTGGGVYKSLDQGQIWEARNKEMGGTSIYNIFMTSSDGERAYAAGEGAEIYKTVDGGSSPWEKLSCTYCGRGAYSLAVRPDNERIVYVGNDQAQIGKSIDGGHTWELLTLGFQYPDLRISVLVIDPKNPDTIYAGTGDSDNLVNDGIYKSTDSGKTWKSISAGLPRDPTGRYYSILAIVIDPNDNQTIYVGGFGGLYRSTGGGDSWEQLTFTPTLPPTPTPTLTPTETPMPTPTPIIIVTATPAIPVPTPSFYPTPQLIGPENKHKFFEGDAARIILQWEPVGPLAENEWYQVVLKFFNQGKIQYNGNRIKETEWQVPKYFQGQADQPERAYFWNVTVIQVNRGSDGKETSIARSPSSETWTFYWP